EGLGGVSLVDGYLSVPAEPVLHSRRGGCPSGRAQHRQAHEAPQRNVRGDAIRGHHAFEEDHGIGPVHVWCDHAGSWHLEARVGALPRGSRGNRARSGRYWLVNVMIYTIT